MKRKLALAKTSSPLPTGSSPKGLLTDLRELIVSARQSVATTVNAALTLLHWQVGKRIREDILKEQRAGYGEEIMVTLSQQLEAEFGRGFGRRNLFSMVRFAEVFPDLKIVQSLIAQLGWTHFLHIIRLDDPLKRDFYAEMCRIERWSTRTLEKKIGSMLFERTALSKKPAKLAALELKQLREEDKLTPDLIFRDPYLLGFLGLKDSYLEKDVEDAILRDMESFIMELGVGFAFLERQKRITIDGVDYYLDLLFYHLRLRCYVVIDLKMKSFEPEFAGKMNFYLSAVDDQLRHADDLPSIGLLLCKERDHLTVEYALRDLKKPIGVAQWQTKLVESLPNNLKGSLPTVAEIEAELDRGRSK